MSVSLSKDTVNHLVSALTKIEQALDPSVKSDELASINWREYHSLLELRNLLKDIPEDKQAKLRTEQEVRSKIKEIEVHLEEHMSQKLKWPDQHAFHNRGSILIQSIHMCYWFLSEDMPKERNFNEPEKANEMGIEHKQSGVASFALHEKGYSQV